ncbi:MAG: redoxin domain-containing protein [Haloarculaceae archaeon]
MVTVGDTAPAFTAPLANGDVVEFSLSDRLDDAPLVLAFFLGAFPGVCTHEMETFEERLDEFDELGATVYGVSVDTPFALDAFRDDAGLSFGLLGDTNRRAVAAFDVRMDLDSTGVENVAKRSVFVLDGDGVVRYAWVSDDPGIEPDYDEVVDAVSDLS